MGRPPQPSGPMSRSAVVIVTAAAADGAAAAVAGGAALSDGLTCPSLALKWRIQQKEIMHRALRYTVAGKGDMTRPGEAPPLRIACGPVAAWDLDALVAEQRRRGKCVATHR
jgi:hypothetical protein